jgi:hypothetical protein
MIFYLCIAEAELFADAKNFEQVVFVGVSVLHTMKMSLTTARLLRPVLSYRVPSMSLQGVEVFQCEISGKSLTWEYLYCL